ncbi:MAG: YggS family pyridoxal phosphate-dependent enzyme [Proteobacteria bacterium]|nr:YggS family pyridoxal phosphate-dependent enzyme [Pseudomonadota bacterium]MBU1648304.1 YggS family pyridoxal phosphate-dependent enzyme [Pseudomonadota bacterium]
MIDHNLQDIRKNISTAALQCGRDPATIRLVAVSKKFPASDIKKAIEAGQFLFGESYIQEAAQKKTEIGDAASFHFIGHLQSNKAKLAAQIFQMIETVDRYKLAATLDKELKLQGKTLDVLIQVNIGQEPQKSGVLLQDAEELFKQLIPLSNLKIRGLMTIPPYHDNPEHTRPHFQALRMLAEELKEKGYFFDNNHVELSMGMSSDYTIAIEEGATLIRIGTALFGHRPTR